MQMGFAFFLNSVLFCIGLAMDAFSVSLANGLREPGMRKRRMFLIAGVFGGFQLLMPLLGWFLVHSLTTAFQVIEKFVPWVALLLLLFIGGKMLYEGIRGLKTETSEEEKTGVSLGSLIVQGIATSIDALSVGLTISSYDFPAALTEACIIGAVTFGICMLGIFLGRLFGMKLKNAAGILGGAILIAIGLEIFITGMAGC